MILMMSKKRLIQYKRNRMEMETDKGTDNKKEKIFEFIRKNPGLTFKRIRFFLELNEGTLNRALRSLIKSEFIEKKVNINGRKKRKIQYFSKYDTSE